MSTHDSLLPSREGTSDRPAQEESDYQNREILRQSNVFLRLIHKLLTKVKETSGSEPVVELRTFHSLLSDLVRHQTELQRDRSGKESGEQDTSLDIVRNFLYEVGICIDLMSSAAPKDVQFYFEQLAMVVGGFNLNESTIVLESTPVVELLKYLRRMSGLTFKEFREEGTPDILVDISSVGIGNSTLARIVNFGLFSARNTAQRNSGGLESYGGDATKELQVKTKYTLDGLIMVMEIPGASFPRSLENQVVISQFDETVGDLYVPNVDKSRGRGDINTFDEGLLHIVGTLSEQVPVSDLKCYSVSTGPSVNARIEIALPYTARVDADAPTSLSFNKDYAGAILCALYASSEGKEVDYPQAKARLIDEINRGLRYDITLGREGSITMSDTAIWQIYDEISLLDITSQSTIKLFDALHRQLDDADSTLDGLVLLATEHPEIISPIFYNELPDQLVRICLLSRSIFPLYHRAVEDIKRRSGTKTAPQLDFFKKLMIGMTDHIVGAQKILIDSQRAGTHHFQKHEMKVLSVIRLVDETADVVRSVEMDAELAY